MGQYVKVVITSYSIHYTKLYDPVYNEKDTIKDIIKAVEETPFRKEIIVIDDGSTDGTRIIV